MQPMRTKSENNSMLQNVNVIKWTNFIFEISGYYSDVAEVQIIREVTPHRQVNMYRRSKDGSDCTFRVRLSCDTSGTAWPWRARHYHLPKCLLTLIRRHCVTSQKTRVFKFYLTFFECGKCKMQTLQLRSGWYSGERLDDFSTLGLWMLDRSTALMI